MGLLISFALAIITASALTFSLGVFVRMLARLLIYWALIPADTFGIIVTEDSPDGRAELGGGNVTGIIHSIPGKFMDTSDPDPMNWMAVPEDNDHREDRGWLYEKLGVQKIDFFRTLRTTIDRRFRYARKDGEEEHPGPSSDESKKQDRYKVVPKDTITKYVYFSGEMDVLVKNADTKGVFGLDFDFTLIFERTYPVRSILRVADSNAVLTKMLSEFVNNRTSSKEPEAYYGGDDAETNKKALVTEMLSNADGGFKKRVLEALGFTITQVFLHSVDMDADHRAYLELTTKAEREKNAELKRATRDVEIAEQKRLARVKQNAGEKDYVDNVILPASATELSTRVFEAAAERDALKENDTITTYAKGVPTMVGSK